MRKGKFLLLLMILLLPVSHSASAGEMSEGGYGEEVSISFEKNVEMTIRDDAGHLVVPGEDNGIRATSDLHFFLENLEEPDCRTVSGESIPGKWAAAVCTGEEPVLGRFEILKGESFDLGVTEDTGLFFRFLDLQSGRLVALPGVPSGYRIHYNPHPDLEIRTDFSSEREKTEGDLAFLSGKPPEFVISPSEDGYTFLRITTPEKSVLYSVTEERRFIFQEGSYSLEAWSEDGRGNREKKKLSCPLFLYDASPPSPPSLSLLTDSEVLPGDGGGILTREAVQLMARSSDPLSGIDRYLFLFSDGRQAEGKTLRLEPDFSDTIRVRAADRAGNLSEETALPGKLILDQTPPVLSGYHVREDPQALLKRGAAGDPDSSCPCTVSFSAGDRLSGLKRIFVTLNGGRLFEQACRGETEKKTVEIGIPFGMLPIGDSKLNVVLTDEAGNRKAHEFLLSRRDETPPSLILGGFGNFQICREPVTLKSSVEDEDIDQGTVFLKIERRGMDGTLLNERILKPGSVTLVEEGRYTVFLTAADKSGNVSEATGFFSIDRSPPLIDSLKEIDRKTFASFSMEGDCRGMIHDYSCTTGSLYLNGKEYDGHRVENPGRYVLKLTAVDELGYAAEEKAEFLIGGSKDGKTGEKTGEDSALTDGAEDGEESRIRSAGKSGTEGKDRTGNDRTGKDRTGKDRTGKVRSGKELTEENPAGKENTGKDRSGKELTGEDPAGKEGGTAGKIRGDGEGTKGVEISGNSPGKKGEARKETRERRGWMNWLRELLDRFRAFFRNTT